MIKKILIGLSFFLSVLHVHLAMWPSIPINPIIIGFLVISRLPFHESILEIIAIIYEMSVNCIVTSFICYYLLKWKSKNIWLQSYLLCLFLCLLLFPLRNAIPSDSAVSYLYLKIYFYHAFPRVVTNSILQILYIILYPLCKRLAYRMRQE